MNNIETNSIDQQRKKFSLPLFLTLIKATISDDLVHEWKKLEHQTSTKPHLSSEFQFISLDHFIIFDDNYVETFHLKEHYWTRSHLLRGNILEGYSYTVQSPCFVRPGLVVDLHRFVGLSLLVLLTWDTDQGSKSFSPNEVVKYESSSQKLLSATQTPPV